MKKFRLSFEMKFTDEVIISEEDYQDIMEQQKEGEALLTQEELREEIADFLGASKGSVEISKYCAEVVCEGEGE